MKNHFKALLASFFLVLCSSPALADDLEGRIESISQSEQSFVVQRIRFFVTQSTDYDDGLKGFADLREGQKVEVDFIAMASTLPRKLNSKINLGLFWCV